MRTRNPKRKPVKTSRSEVAGGATSKEKRKALSVEERIAELAIKSDKGGKEHKSTPSDQPKVNNKEAVPDNTSSEKMPDNSAERTVVSQEHSLNEKTVLTEEKVVASEKPDGKEHAAQSTEDNNSDADIKTVPPLAKNQDEDTESVGEVDSTNINPVPIEIEVEESSSLFMRSIVPVVIGIIVGFLTGLSVIYYSQNGGSSLGNILGFLNTAKSSSSSDSAAIAVITPSAGPSEAPVTPTDVVNEKDLYDIKILNGSGKGGEAARLEGILKGKDYSILEIGNASASNFKETVIEVKKNVSAGFLASLKKDLDEVFELADDTKELDEDEESDVIITIGSNPAASATDN